MGRRLDNGNQEHHKIIPEEMRDEWMDPLWEDEFPEAYVFYKAEVGRIKSMAAKSRDQKAADVIVARLESYKNFVRFLFEGDAEYPGPYTNPLSMQRQMTFDQYLKFIVMERIPKKVICDTLQRMENYNMPKYFKKERKYLGLTLKDWLARQNGQVPSDTGSAASVPKRVRQ